MHGLTNSDLVNEVKYRLNNLEVDSLLSAGELEQLISDSNILVKFFSISIIDFFIKNNFSNRNMHIKDDIIEINNKLIFTCSSYFNSFFEKILGANSHNGIILICNSLLFGFILYYSIKYLFSHFNYNQIEKPSQFIFKIIIFGICINFSYFFIKEILSFTSNITLAIRGIGEDLFNKNICFSELILEINKSIGISFSSLDVFSLDGIIKISLSSSLLSLVFTYAFRYIMVKIFILLTPVAFLSLILQNTSWFFKSWIRNLFSLLFIQIIVSLVLLILFSMDYSSGNLIIKFIYIGAIYALIKANSFSREFLGGVSTTISQNVNNFFKK